MMTVTCCVNLIFKWLETNDNIFISSNITAKDNVKDIFTISESKETDEALLRISLEYFEKLDILKKSVTGKGTYWFLNKPFDSYSQNIELNANLCVSIADFINKFCENNKNNADYCNAVEITQKDIKNLLVLALHFYKEANKLKNSNELN